jgi:hypothetical protein
VPSVCHQFCGLDGHAIIWMSSYRTVANDSQSLLLGQIESHFAGLDWTASGSLGGGIDGSLGGRVGTSLGAGIIAPSEQVL